MSLHLCQARCVGSQMVCTHCNLVWDINDPEPPECPVIARQEKKDAQDWVDRQMSFVFDENDNPRI